MPDVKILQEPGLNSQATATLNRIGWSAGNLIRWQEGYLQKTGGWEAFSNDPVVGVGRSLHAWQDLDNNQYLTVGTNERLQIYTAGQQYDITPVTSTENLTNPFTTTATSTTVTVADTAHGRVAGDWIYCVMPIAVGGIIIFGYYQVASVVDANSYTITLASAAVSSVAGGGIPPAFATVNLSPTVTVTLVNHGYAVSDIFTVQVSTSIAGLTLTGEYIILTTPTADTFTFSAGSNANATTTATENGGDVRLLYLLASGPSSTETLTGWGSGGWGSGGWGVGAGGSVAYDPVRIWSQDNFGEIWVGCPTNGSVYSWQPPNTDTRAALVASAPTINTGLFVAMPQAQVMCYGSETGSVQDPLLIRWSDAGSYSNFTATVTNQAGSFRLSRGSVIVGGLQAANMSLFWTDLDLWAASYQGLPYVYSFNMIGQGCGLIANNAACSLGAETFWMSKKGFFRLSGGAVQPIPCPVWDTVFLDNGGIDTANQDKVVAAANTPFNEVAWFYPHSDGDGEINAYIRLNITNGLWDYGRLVRTGWIDQNIFGMPLAIDADGYVQQHEIGYNDNDQAMADVSATSGYADLAEGLIFIFIDQIIPDFKWEGDDPSVEFTVYVTNFPGETPREYGPYTITPTTTYISLRARGRQIAFKIESSSYGTFWRLGAIRYRGAPAGRR